MLWLDIIVDSLMKTTASALILTHFHSTSSSLSVRFWVFLNNLNISRQKVTLIIWKLMISWWTTSNRCFTNQFLLTYSWWLSRFSPSSQMETSLQVMRFFFLTRRRQILWPCLCDLIWIIFSVHWCADPPLAAELMRWWRQLSLSPQWATGLLRFFSPSSSSWEVCDFGCLKNKTFPKSETVFSPN